jgi:bacillithiol synthase
MTSDITFHLIPRQSKLFLNYIDLSPNALRFYQRPPTMESLEETARSSLKELKFPRNEMAPILRRQNESVGAGAATLARIAELEKPDSVAILTGQQVGIWGGPLYTIYKAITAIKLADELKNRGIPAVPIFWMDTEDHDLEEVSHCTVFDGVNALTVDYRNILFGERIKSANSVGSIVFPEKIREAIEDYLGHLPDAEWNAAVRLQIESAYKPGSSFGNSFAALLSRIFDGSGLILFDPQDSTTKPFVSRLFQKALREANAIRTSLVQRNHELEAAGFHSQVSILEGSTVLFLSKDGQRRALEQRQSGFGLKGGEQAFSLDALLESAVQNPELFSSNVLLRPLVQDHLFPTVAYVGGSAEIAYFAQIEILYSLFGRPMPVIWPRNSFTLIEPEIGSKMKQFGLSVQDFFEGKQFVTEAAFRNAGFSKAVACVEELQKKLDQVLGDMRPELVSTEPTLAQSLDTARKKIDHNTQLLKSRIVRLETARNYSLPNEIDAMFNSCYPNHSLQEREFSIHQFVARHGPSLLDSIRQSADPENFNHRTLRL